MITSQASSKTNDYTIEVLVAVDKKMREYHGKNLENYVLTLMSVVGVCESSHSFFGENWAKLSSNYNYVLINRFQRSTPMLVLGTQ